MAAPTSPEAPDGPPPGVHLHGWRHPSVVAAAVFSVYAGFSQFAATAALPDIAAAFGEQTEGGTSVVAQVGLSGTTLGLGLGIIRLASLATQPLAMQADRHGRRRTLLIVTSLGLALTALASLSPTFWAFVVILAVARPLLSTTNAVAGVIGAEETVAAHRTKALALITVGYGTGAGIPVILRGITDGAIGFRPLFAIGGLLLLTLPVVARWVREPDRSAKLDHSPIAAKRLGRVPAPMVPRLALLASIAFLIGFLTGPVNTYLFVYAENVAGVSPGILAVVVPTAGVVGASGLLLGIRLADRMGRTRTAALAQFALGVTGFATYSGSPAAAVVGYVGTIFAGSTFAPATAALGSEIFPTSIRASAAGWVTVASTVGAVTGLLVFGWIADLTESFTTAAAVVALPVMLGTVAYRFLPETRGMELEESAPEL